MNSERAGHDSHGRLVPVGELLSNFAVHPLDDDDVVVGAFILLKTVDVDGNGSWSFRSTEPTNPEELLGALTIQVELIKAAMLQDWEE